MKKDVPGNMNMKTFIFFLICNIANHQREVKIAGYLVWRVYDRDVVKVNKNAKTKE